MQHYTRIRDLREDSDLTQEALCKKLYMHKTTYTNYEQGKHTVPFDFAVTLARFYKVSLDYIAGLTNFKKGKANPEFTDEQLKIVEQYSKLSEKNKGRLELFMEQLIEKQENE
jgi:transcriptional regulator with XRE-family HTH domain